MLSLNQNGGLQTLSSFHQQNGTMWLLFPPAASMNTFPVLCIPLQIAR
jgi:hypothetical protein